MTILDLILLLVLLCFVLTGLRLGLIHTLGALLGIIVGTLVAGHYYDSAAGELSFIFGSHLNLARILCFAFIFIITNRLFGLLFILINKIFKIISIIPFLKTINRLAGAILGFIEGTFVLGLILYVAQKYPFWDFLNKMIASSKVSYFLLKVASILVPLLPSALRHLKTFIK